MPRGVGDGELDDALDVARHLPAARESEARGVGKASERERRSGIPPFCKGRSGFETQRTAAA